jgi:hypothetical protein
VLVLILTILDFAALHDIKQDYVSEYILNYLDVSLSEELPEWTSTKGEWHLVTLSLYLRFLFFILNFGLLVYYYRKIISNKSGT